jgi:hypothetical protein
MSGAGSQLLGNIKLVEKQLSPVGRTITAISAAISGLVGGYAYLRPYLPAALPNLPTLVPWTILFQAFTVFSLWSLVHHLPEMSREAKYEDAITASRQFQRFWFGIWLAWFILYLGWTIDEFLPDGVGTAIRSHNLLHWILQYLEDFANLESGRCSSCPIS